MPDEAKSHEELDVSAEDTPPLKVTFKKEPKEPSIYDSTDCIEYDDMRITDKEIEEHDNPST